MATAGGGQLEVGFDNEQAQCSVGNATCQTSKVNLMSFRCRCQLAHSAPLLLLYLLWLASNGISCFSHGYESGERNVLCSKRNREADEECVPVNADREM